MRHGEERSEKMFDDRMDEALEWVQLDLDEISNGISGNGLIVPICHQIDAWRIDKPTCQREDISQVLLW